MTALAAAFDRAQELDMEALHESQHQMDLIAAANFKGNCLSDDELAEISQMADYDAMRGNTLANQMSDLQEAEQMAFEASQPKLDASEAQAIELTRYLSNEEADAEAEGELLTARFNTMNGCNLPVGDEYAVTLDVEEAEHARFNAGLNNNLQGC